jgi:hypothetical protein
LKKTNHKKSTGGMAQGTGPEFKPQYRRGKKTPKKPARDIVLSVRALGTGPRFDHQQ